MRYTFLKGLCILFVFSLTLLCTLLPTGGTTVRAASEDDVYMRFPGGRAKVFTMSFDDGVVQDRQLVPMLKSYGLKATFYLCSGRMLNTDTVTDREITDLYMAAGMEVASHTTTHPDLPTVLAQQGQDGIKAEVFDDIAYFENLTGSKIYGIAYPGAPPFIHYNDELVEYLRKNGLGYGRVTQATNSFNMPTDWLQWHPTAHFNDAIVAKLTERFIGLEVTGAPRMFYLWGHAYEFGSNGCITMEAFGETVCRQLAGCEDIWYATNGEVYSYSAAFESGLKISKSKDTITNQSDRSLWFTCNGQNIRLHPGETVTGVFAGTHGSSDDFSSDTPDLPPTTTVVPTTATTTATTTVKTAVTSAVTEKTTVTPTEVTTTATTAKTTTVTTTATPTATQPDSSQQPAAPAEDDAPVGLIAGLAAVAAALVGAIVWLLVHKKKST